MSGNKEIWYQCMEARSKCKKDILSGYVVLPERAIFYKKKKTFL